MKRIEKGPVRGISLKLQEMVSHSIPLPCAPLTPWLRFSGKRKKAGLHPRKVGDRYRQHRGQEGRQRAYQGARHQEACRLLQAREAKERQKAVSIPVLRYVSQASRAQEPYFKMYLATGSFWKSLPAPGSVKPPLFLISTLEMSLNKPNGFTFNNSKERSLYTFIYF